MEYVFLAIGIFWAADLIKSSDVSRRDYIIRQNQKHIAHLQKQLDALYARPEEDEEDDGNVADTSEAETETDEEADEEAEAEAEAAPAAEEPPVAAHADDEEFEAATKEFNAVMRAYNNPDMQGHTSNMGHVAIITNYFQLFTNKLKAEIAVLKQQIDSDEDSMELILRLKGRVDDLELENKNCSTMIGLICIVLGVSSLLFSVAVWVTHIKASPLLRGA